jgi:DNA replicative helicase MCM subunit Mcm2 (Cdc46/Mcm family)
LSEPDVAFNEFLKTFESGGKRKYEERIARMLQKDLPVITIDYQDLAMDNSDFAVSLVRSPDKVLEFMHTAVYEILKDKYPQYAATLDPDDIFVKVVGVDNRVDLRKIGTRNLNQMIYTSGIVTSMTTPGHFVTVAAWRCPNGDITSVKQQHPLWLERPAMCSGEDCESKVFRLDLELSKYIDFQKVALQELPEETPAGEVPRAFNVNLFADNINIVRPGDRIGVVGVVKAVPEGKEGRVFDTQLYASYVEQLNKDPQNIYISEDDKKKFVAIAAAPDAYKKLIDSVAPAISGHDDEKEAILLVLAGSPPTVLPDGTRLRGDPHTLFCGDPGCIVGSERVVLENGAMVKIESLGTSHLQDIKVSLRTGKANRKTAFATRFHVYHSQPTLRITTESGKTIRGTYNHPLLLVNGGKKVWKRLDELSVGDRIAVTTGISCNIRNYIGTGFQDIPYHRGPRFHGNLPDRVTPQLAAFLGYVLGDGWVTRYKVSCLVNDTEADLVGPLFELASSLFGLIPGIRRTKPTQTMIGPRQVNSRQSLTEIVVHSQNVASNLRFLKTKRVPELIFASGNKVTAHFLRWLFEADGCVFSKGRGRRAIQLKSSSPGLLSDVQLLLLRFGVPSRINGNNLAIRSRRGILAFGKNIGFVSSKKKSLLTKLVADVSNTSHQSRLRPDERIVAIDEMPPADVYDVEVPEEHRFIANGIISHNTAKSAMLRFASEVAPRSMLVSGTGASRAGLSAAVVKNADGTSVLEAGTMVLADGGIAVVDEAEKMRNEDRVALHEAMEQGTVSIQKAGFHVKLNARASVLAAANPNQGRYNPDLSLVDQINFLPSLISRFDLIFVVRDERTKEADEKIASHIVELRKKRGYVSPPPVPFELLRKYIAFCKRISPYPTDAANKKLKEYYLHMRANVPMGGIPPTPRTLESLIRLATCRARVLLRVEVTAEDADAVIRLMERFVYDVATDKTTGKMDFGEAELGVSASARSETEIFDLAIIELSATSANGQFPREALVEKLEASGKFDEMKVDKFIEKARAVGRLYEPKSGYYARVEG